MIPDPGEAEHKAFVRWVKNMFDNDPIAIHLTLQIYRALQDKQFDMIGLIVESEPEPISDSEIANLALYLTEKGLPRKHKRDTLD